MQAHSKLSVDVSLTDRPSVYAAALVQEWDGLVQAHGALARRHKSLSATAAQMHADLLDLIDALGPLLAGQASAEQWDAVELIADRLNTTYRKDHR